MAEEADNLPEPETPSAVEARLAALEAQLAQAERLAALEQRIRQLPAVSPPTASNRRTELVALAFGLCLFGGAIGLITGLSEVQGISQTLLTSALGFAGGSLLTYLGSKQVDGLTQNAGLSGVRAGVGLGSFALGVMVFALAGVWLRLVGIPLPADAAKPARASATATATRADGSETSDGARASEPSGGATQDDSQKLALRGDEGRPELGELTARVNAAVQHGNWNDAQLMCTEYWPEHASLAADCGRTYRTYRDRQKARALLQLAAQLQPADSETVSADELQWLQEAAD